MQDYEHFHRCVRSSVPGEWSNAYMHSSSLPEVTLKLFCWQYDHDLRRKLFNCLLQFLLPTAGSILLSNSSRAQSACESQLPCTLSRAPACN